MKNATNFSLFSKGKKDGALHLSTQEQVQMKNYSVIYRLGYLYGSSENCPQLMQLILELYKNFSFSIRTQFFIKFLIILITQTYQFFLYIFHKLPLLPQTNIYYITKLHKSKVVLYIFTEKQFNFVSFNRIQKRAYNSFQL